MKLLKLFLLSIILLISNVSCDSDSGNDSENEIIGVWLRNDSDENFEERITFNADSTGVNFFLDGSFTNTTNFTWTTINDILTMTTEDDSFTSQYEIDNNELKLTMVEDGNNILLVYIRQ